MKTSAELFGVSSALPLGLVPIVVGVTGHRDVPLEDELRLFTAVADALNKLASDTPNSPHVLLSALAEGSDRIVARVALEIGWTLGVVLPAPALMYEQDFATEDSRTDFHQLLGKASWIETLPAETTGTISYRQAGLRIARQSLFLLALWDGDESKVVEGGTADIVNLFLHGIPEPSFPGPADNSLPEARPVWHVLTRRRSALALIPANEVGRMQKLSPEPEGTTSSDYELERWVAVTRRIDLFNTDAVSRLTGNSDLVQQVRKKLGKDAHLDLPASATAARVLHAVSDNISLQTQGKRDRQLWLLFGLTLVAVFCQQTYSGPVWHAGWLAAAIGFAALAAALHQWGARTRLEEQYLDYRVLAEACRVQYFWKRAGVMACAADHFLRDQRDELEWLRQAVRTTELMPGRVVATSDRIQGVARDWIDDQRKWFIGDGSPTSGKAGWNDAQGHRLSRRAHSLFKCGIAVAVALLLLHVFAVPHFNKAEQDALQWMIVAYGMLFGMSGMVAVYLEVKAFSEHARAYRRMGLVMGIARRNLDEALARGDLKAAEYVLLGTGRDAMEENGGWLLLHRDRPAQVPLV